MYCGTKVIQNPMNSSQKWTFPRRSLSIRPNILGYQK